jgi:hypothetical protein
MFSTGIIARVPASPRCIVLSIVIGAFIFSFRFEGSKCALVTPARFGRPSPIDSVKLSAALTFAISTLGVLAATVAFVV